MSSGGRTFEIATSPHMVNTITTDVIMRNVVYALLPVSCFAVYLFGLPALVTLTTATASCILSEYLLCRLSGKPSSIGDWSVAITGLLYGLTLPPGLPIWMTFLGGFIAVAIGKHLFGGLGANAFNPALVGRAVLQAAFPVAMTSWSAPLSPERFSVLPASTMTLPLAAPAYDAVSIATPLGSFKFEQQLTPTNDLLLGLTSGSAGETGALLIIAGGVYLAARNMLNWRIPAAILITVALLCGILHQLDPAAYPPPMFMLLSGGLMLGAVFMATDMVASPLTTPAILIYGALIGALVVAIRIWGGLPEGVMYSILLANAISPHLDRLIQPRVFGTGKARSLG